jgi:hypothetical protein
MALCCMMFLVQVTAEDELESLAQRFLSASLQLRRPPKLCAAFVGSPDAVTAAHNCTAKVRGAPAMGGGCAMHGWAVWVPGPPMRPALAVAVPVPPIRPRTPCTLALTLLALPGRGRARVAGLARLQDAHRGRHGEASPPSVPGGPG